MGTDTTKVLKPDDDKSDDTNPLIPDKIENDLKKSKFGRWILWACSLVFVPIIGWGGDRIIGVYNSFEELRQQVHDLQNDATSTTAIWKSIAENRETLTSLRIQNETMTRLFDREFNKSVFDRYLEFKMMQEMHPTKPDDGQKSIVPPVPVPLPVPRPVPVPTPRPEFPVPGPKPPDKAERPKFDADVFRKEYEDKYPRQTPQQKKP